jgi:CBS domain-containing protein
MVRRGFRHLPVVDEAGRVLGILSAQDVVDVLAQQVRLFRAAGEPRRLAVLGALEQPVASVMSPDPVCAPSTGTLLEAVDRMAQRNVGAVPILGEGMQLRGIVTLRDLVSLLGVGKDALGIQVRELMTRNPTCVAPTEAISAAIVLMSQRRIRRIPLLEDVSGGRGLQGVVTNKDVLRYVDGGISFSRLKPVEALDAPVRGIKGSDAHMLSADEDVRSAALHMMTFGIGGLLVMQGDLLHGIITERDLVLTLYRSKGAEFFARAARPEDDLTDRPSW